MINLKPMETTEPSDAHLVAESLAGSREAFGRIVARYQALICSVAYSGTGSLSQSEDVAQETFLAAWKQLVNLREPHKLRSWLCGITRHLTCDALKKQGREPSHAAESLDSIHEWPAPDAPPHDLAITNEEAAILWRSLEHIPEVYREPLVLFYREHRSVEAVAEQLDLSEDAVKQRLSRGRKLLHERVVAFVEGALAQTNPGKAFTLGVLAALPALTISAKAATVGATVAKGSATAKAAATAGMFGSIFAPVLGFLGMWVGYRLSVNTAQSTRERDFVKSFHQRLILCLAGFVVALALVMFSAWRSGERLHLLFVFLVIGVALAYTGALAALSIWTGMARRKLVSELTAEEAATNPTKPVWEYRSRFHLLGLPLIHIRMGDRLAAPLKAWIAMGDCAFGVLFAFGGLAIAPVSVGGCALGLFSVGGCAIGLLALGGCSLGIWSFGGLALGWQAFGMCAIGWNAAMGAAAVAREFALGDFVQAAKANNEIAAQFFRSNLFFRGAQIVYRYYYWLNLIWVLPAIVWWRINVRRGSQGKL
jgi:RNA polymerase sigma factor (sigma-70 family)